MCHQQIMECWLFHLRPHHVTTDRLITNFYDAFLLIDGDSVILSVNLKYLIEKKWENFHAWIECRMGNLDHISATLSARMKWLNRNEWSCDVLFLLRRSIQSHSTQLTAHSIHRIGFNLYLEACSFSRVNDIAVTLWLRLIYFHHITMCMCNFIYCMAFGSFVCTFLVNSSEMIRIKYCDTFAPSVNSHIIYICVVIAKAAISYRCCSASMCCEQTEWITILNRQTLT